MYFSRLPQLPQNRDGSKEEDSEPPKPTLQENCIYMRRPTYAELKSRVSELEEENQTLNEKLDSILDIASDEGDEEEEEDDEDE